VKPGLLTLTALVAVLSAGCASGPQRRANARLRDDNAQLQQAVTAETLKVSELEAQIEALRQTYPALAPEALVPQVAAISIGSGSGLDPSPPDDTPVLQVLVHAVDGRGRPIQLAGTLEVQVLQSHTGEAPSLVASTALDGEHVREAWRGGPFGTHWLVEVPLLQDTALDSLLVHVRYVDLRTGRTLTATGSIKHSGG
jgi:hypothetical protein